MTFLAILISAVSVVITPSHCFEPCLIKYVVTVPEWEKVREVCIHIEDTYSRTACWPPMFKTTNTQLRDVPAGEYKSWASVILLDKSEVSTPQKDIKVIGENGAEE